MSWIVGGEALGPQPIRAFVTITVKSVLFGIWCYKASRHHIMCCKGRLQPWTVTTVLGHKEIFEKIQSLVNQLAMHNDP